MEVVSLLITGDIECHSGSTSNVAPGRPFLSNRMAQRRIDLRTTSGRSKRAARGRLVRKGISCIDAHQFIKPGRMGSTGDSGDAGTGYVLFLPGLRILDVRH